MYKFSNLDRDKEHNLAFNLAVVKRLSEKVLLTGIGEATQNGVFGRIAFDRTISPQTKIHISPIGLSSKGDIFTPEIRGQHNFDDYYIFGNTTLVSHHI